MTTFPALPGPGDHSLWMAAQKQLISSLRGHSLIQAYIGALQIQHRNGGFVVIQPECSLTKRRSPNVFVLPEGFRFAEIGELPNV